MPDGAVLASNWAKVESGVCWQDGDALVAANGWMRCPTCCVAFQTAADGRRIERRPLGPFLRGKRFPATTSWKRGKFKFVRESGAVEPALIEWDHYEGRPDLGLEAHSTEEVVVPMDAVAIDAYYEPATAALIA